MRRRNGLVSARTSRSLESKSLRSSEGMATGVAVTETARRRAPREDATVGRCMMVVIDVDQL